MTIQEMEQRIIKKFPDAEFEIIKTDGRVLHPITIKCLKCGTEKEYTTFSNGVMGAKKTTFCTNCVRLAPTPMQEQAMKIINDREDLEFVKWIGRGTKGKVVFKCLKCGKETDRLLHKFVTQERQKCAWCSDNARRKDQEMVKETFNDLGFEMLEPYKDSHTPIHFRHTACGFIYCVSPTNLVERANCPRCKSHESAGERVIRKYFDDRNIEYTKEKTFDWLGRAYRYDFYVPKFNLLIEFMGRQHYISIPFFLQERSFEEQQESDRVKQEKALENGYNYLVIKYNEVKNIPSILDSTTTNLQDVDSSESK